MRFRHGFLVALGTASFVAACAQTAPEPAPIQAEPIFNKVGEPTGKCTGGYDYNSQTQTCEPPRCENGYDAQGMPCDLINDGGGNNGGNGDNGGNNNIPGASNY